MDAFLKTGKTQTTNKIKTNKINEQKKTQQPWVEK